MRNWLIILGIFVIQGTCVAQMRGWELGGWLGGSNYFGDLNTGWRLNRSNLSAGAGARYNFNDRLCLKFGLNYGSISGYDKDSKNIYERTRNLHFKSIIADATAQFEFNFMPYVHGSRDYYYTPYMFVGPTFFYFNPRAELDDSYYNLVEYGTEGQFTGEEYNLTQGALAYGFGFKMDLSYRWSINVELAARRLFTDYLDDVSGVYADSRDVRAFRGAIGEALADRSGEPKVGLPGRQRGNGKKNDSYAFLHIGVQYYFGQIRCPGVSKY